MLTAKEGYAIAESMDAILGRTLDKDPVENPKNYRGYAVLLRTIGSTIDLLEQENNKHLPRCPACGKAR